MPSSGVFTHRIIGCLLEQRSGLSKHRYTHTPVCPNADIHRILCVCGPAQMCADTLVMDLNSNSHSEVSRPLGQQRISIPVTDDCP